MPGTRAFYDGQNEAQRQGEVGGLQPNQQRVYYGERPQDRQFTLSLKRVV